MASPDATEVWGSMCRGEQPLAFMAGLLLGSPTRLVWSRVDSDRCSIPENSMSSGTAWSLSDETCYGRGGSAKLHVLFGLALIAFAVSLISITSIEQLTA